VIGRMRAALMQAGALRPAPRRADLDGDDQELGTVAPSESPATVSNR